MAVSLLECNMPIMPQSVGLLGGTFDPIHQGHLVMAEWVWSQMGLQKVIFIPAGQPPHKADRPVTAKHHRLAMVEKAIADHAHFEVSRFEVERERPSLTIETLQALSPQFSAKPVFIIGLDSLLTLHTWDKWELFGNYCQLAVVSRPQAMLLSSAAIEVYIQTYLAPLAGQIHVLEMPLLEISSTLIRERIRAGYACRYLMPSAVWEYLQSQQLYR